MSIEYIENKESKQISQKNGKEDFLQVKNKLLTEYTQNQKNDEELLSKVIDVLHDDCTKNNRDTNKVEECFEKQNILIRNGNNIFSESITGILRTILYDINSTNLVYQDTLNQTLNQEKESVNQEKESVNQEKESVNQEKEKLLSLFSKQQTLYEQTLAQNPKLSPANNPEDFAKHQQHVRKVLESSNTAKNLTENQKQAYINYSFVYESIQQLTPQEKLQFSAFTTGFLALNASLNLPQPTRTEKPISSPEKLYTQPSVQQLSTNPELIRQNTDIQKYTADSSIKSPTQEITSAKSKEEQLQRIHLLSPEQRTTIREQTLNSMNTIDQQILQNIDRETFTIKKKQKVFSEQQQQQQTEFYNRLLNNADLQTTQYMQQNIDQTIKQQSIVGLIQHFCSYFDITRNLENFAKNMQLDQQQGIQFDGTHLQIKGSIEDSRFHFIYNTQTGELQSEDFIHRLHDDEKSKIQVGTDDNNRQKVGRNIVPTRLPKIHDRQQTLAQNLQLPALKDIKDATDYENQLNQQSQRIVEKLNKRNTITRSMIQYSMEKNLALQETYNRFPQYQNNDITPENPSIHRLLTIVDKTADYYTTKELRLLRDNRKRWDAIIARYGNKKNPPTNPDPFVESLFSPERLAQERIEWNNPTYRSSWEQLLSACTYNTDNPHKKDVINPTLLQEIITRLEKGDRLDETQLLSRHQNLLKEYEDVVAGQDVDAIEKKLENMP